MTRPRIGDSVHYVENRGLHCATAIICGTTHPEYGDDGQWCLSMDTFIGGQATLRRTHVAHGAESGHWHYAIECTRTNGVT